MVDTNYGMDVETAIAAARAMEPVNLLWFEEPVDPDDFESYRPIAAEIGARNGLSVCRHDMQELHVSLLAGWPNSGWLEVHSFPIDQYTTRPRVHGVTPWR